MLRDYYPKRKPIGAQEIFNLKVRVRLMAEELKKSGQYRNTKHPLKSCSRGWMMKTLMVTKFSAVVNTYKNAFSGMR
jgi:hypothetical protein